MSVRRETRERGTGITARKVEGVEITGSIGAQEREALADLFRGPFDFEGLYGERLEAECHKRLLDAGIERTRKVLGKIIPARNWREAVEDRGGAEDTPQGFAARIFDGLESARQFASGAEAKNASFLGTAMRYTFELGALAMQADMKIQHEPDADRGKRQREGSKKARDRRAADQAAGIEARDKQIRDALNDPNLARLGPAQRRARVQKMLGFSLSMVERAAGLKK